MQLHPRRAQFRGELDLWFVGIDEETRRDPGSVHRLHARAHALAVAHHIEATLGRDFLTALRHEADGVGFQFQRQRDHLGRAAHFEVETRGHALAQPPHVAVLHVPPVLAQMHRDAVGAGAFGEEAEGHRIGLHGAAHRGRSLAIAGLPHGGAVVDIDAEKNHGTEV